MKTTLGTFLLAWLLALASASAQSSARFTITRGVIGGGGTTFSSGSRFQLGGTLAQPLSAVPSSSRFSIQGGFWIWPSPTFFGPTKVGNNLIVSFQTTPGTPSRCNTRIHWLRHIGRTCRALRAPGGRWPSP